MRIVAIVPFLNEEEFLPRFLASLAAQTRPPDRLLLVDDGSTDASHKVAAGFAARNSYAVALRRPKRPAQRDRLATAAELRAFLWGVERIGEPWDVVAKLDGDLELTTETIAVLEDRLVRNPDLGMVGSYLTEEDPTGVRARLRIHADHVHGATKFYRRECYEQIAPLPAIIGWDSIDEMKARMLGWRTESVALPGGDPLHLRKRASYDGVARGLRRSGEGAHALGAHPLHVLLIALRHMAQEPGLSGGFHYLAGWTGASLRGYPRAEPEVRSQVRRGDIRRIRRRLLSELGLMRPVAGREMPADV
jgi:poly-beta-1,6-N-acetyl-D-glucosamine synthase